MTVVNAAFEATNNVCAAIERNQACYGNATIAVTPSDATNPLRFEQAGDLVDISAIETLQLSSWTNETWGVAVMQLQANLPDTVPGQNVTFLLFGDVQISDASAEVVETTLTVTAPVNVRQHPTTNVANVIASLAAGTEVIANGRLNDNTWVRVTLPDNAAAVGWVAADFVTGEITSLLPVTTQQEVFGAMQAFYFRTTITGMDCERAPESGILIQTPEGAGQITLAANGVQIQLGSTIYLQTNDQYMLVYVLEGYAILAANGGQQIVPAGTFARVALDANGRATGTPEFPQPYDYQQMRRLPVRNVPLPRNIQVTTQVEGDEVELRIAVAESLINGLLPPSGRWRHTARLVINTCGNNGSVGDVWDIDANFTFAADGMSFLWEEPAGTFAVARRTGDTSFRLYTLPSYQDITFTSPTTLESVAHHVGSNGCIWEAHTNGYYVGG